MENIILYLVKANLLIAALFLFYFFFLRNQKFFRINRFFLLGALIISLFLPLIPAMPNFTNPLRQDSPGIHTLLDFYAHLPITERSLLPAAQVAGHSPDSLFTLIKGLSLIQILAGIYTLISFILLARFFSQIYQLITVINNSKRWQANKITYCETNRRLAPFSFFHYIILNRSSFTEQQLLPVIAHEKVHARQWHTLDILFSELVYCLFWINPFTLYLKRQLKLNLEYTVDDSILDKGFDKKNYQLTILHSCLNHHAYPLGNLFNSSKLKLRIKMMNTKKTPKTNLFKYALALPLVLAGYFLINPLNAKTMDSINRKVKDEVRGKSLKAFEGTYVFTFEGQKDPSYIQITARDTTLILKQTWDGREIVFSQVSPLEFFNKEFKFPLKFTRNKKGVITQVLAFNKDLWNRTENYKPVVKTAIHLEPHQLKAFEGIYRGQDKKEAGDKNAYIQFTATDTGLILKQGWDGKEIAFSPESSLDFFCGNPAFTLKFTRSQNGVITQVLAFNHDLWIKDRK